jgi:pimeloyl-ACP methyl ester carboxylesterase
MRPPNLALVSALFFASLHLPLNAQQRPAAITTDPGPDKTNPAAMQTFQIPSHGAMLNAVAYLRDPAHAKKLRSDPAYIVLIGHSMGGFMARYAGAQDPAIKAVGLISAADMGVDRMQSLKPAQEKEATARLAAHLASLGMAPLAGCTPESLAKEVIANAAAWNVPNLAPKLATRPVLVITSNDGTAPSNDAFVAALHKAGATDITTVHLTTDHSYSDQRIALEKAVLEALEYLQHK